MPTQIPLLFPYLHPVSNPQHLELSLSILTTFEKVIKISMLPASKI